MKQMKRCPLVQCGPDGAAIVFGNAIFYVSQTVGSLIKKYKSNLSNKLIYLY